MQNADKAVIKNRYGSVKAGAIKDAKIDLMNCKFTSGDLDNLQINSKYSTITFQNAAVSTIKSVSDQYTIAKAGSIVVEKSFGKLQIEQLGNSIKLTGSSADLEIKAIDASATLVQVNNKYANVKIPLEKLSNYIVQFDGLNSQVATAFEKIKMNGPDSTAVANASFTKTVGNITSDFTSLVVNCTSCQVDFR
jgi:hypothetical protein